MVFNEVQPQLAELAAVAGELNAVTDGYTNELRQLEAELSKINLGLEVRLQKSFWSDADSFEVESIGHGPREIDSAYLAYGRHGQQWRILVNIVRVTEEMDEGNVVERNIDDHGYRPLLDCTRELRLAAADHLPLLLTTIADTARSKVASLKKVTDKK